MLGKLKHIATLLFAGLYFFFAVGVGLNVHYCGGQKAEVSIIFQSSSCACDAVGQDSCCKDEQVFYQLEEDQQVVTSLQVATADEIDLPINHQLLRASEDDREPVNYGHERAPPNQGPPIYIRNASLTFYG